jgi:transposase
VAALERIRSELGWEPRKPTWRNHDRRRLGRRQAHPDGYGD